MFEFNSAVYKICCFIHVQLFSVLVQGMLHLYISSHIHVVTPYTRCRLKLLKMERIKDFLVMEEELIQNQGRLKPQEQRNEVCWVL